MPSSKRQRHLKNLDSSVIAIPLLRNIEEAEEGGRFFDRIPVLIEINLIRPETRWRTIEQARELIAKVKDEEYEKTDWEDYADQYLFASLTPSQIRALSHANNRCRYSDSSIQNSRAGESDDDTQTNFGTKRHCPIYKIWPDFPVDFLLTASASTVKADAAQISFAANGRQIVWAVIDSGIDGSHPHFAKYKNLDLPYPLSHWDFSGDEPAPVENRCDLVDSHSHGTHIAGIIAGEIDEKFVGDDQRALVRSLGPDGEETQEFKNVAGIKGLAPECKIVSLKVADEKGNVRTSRIIAALGYVRKMNGDGRLPRIHGVNISLEHAFDPEWFACGQSPLCIEVDRLVKSGTCVVVAAGNGGYGEVNTLYKETIKAGLSNTLRDPANARLAITVGSTHRYMPHIYGVSYFSSKGPTGDGRLKPDLVAPGEKIISCASRQHHNGDFRYVEQSGTSIAAAHVSGCIAAFLSIRSEFKNRPERVKEIFLDTATDLGRERYFQGNGLVDLMRAIQSV